MRAFGVLGANPVIKGGLGRVLLPGLLVFHAVLSGSMVVGGRSGFERIVGPGEASYWLCAVVAVCGVIGVGVQLCRVLGWAEKITCAGAALLPFVWLWAAVARPNYDVLTAMFSTTSWGEQGEYWFPGVPIAAMAYTCALFAYTQACAHAWSSVDVRYRPSVQWVLWSLCAVGVAGIVHWATGF